LTPVNVMQMAQVTLPEIVVTGQRAQAGRVAASRTGQPAVLPALVVAAADWALADDGRAKTPGASPATVLLK
jgi:hypothetical protein